MMKKKKPWHVIKIIVCEFSGEQCMDACDYELPVSIPDCENCDLYEEAKVV